MEQRTKDVREIQESESTLSKLISFRGFCAVFFPVLTGLLLSYQAFTQLLFVPFNAQAAITFEAVSLLGPPGREQGEILIVVPKIIRSAAIKTGG